MWIKSYRYLKLTNLSFNEVDCVIILGSVLPFHIHNHPIFESNLLLRTNITSYHQILDIDLPLTLEKIEGSTKTIIVLTKAISTIKLDITWGKQINNLKVIWSRIVILVEFKDGFAISWYDKTSLPCHRLWDKKYCFVMCA